MWRYDLFRKLVLLTVCFLCCTCQEDPRQPLSGLDPEPTNVRARFSKELYRVANDFTVGYQNGLLQSTNITLRWSISNIENMRAMLLYRETKLLTTITNRQTNSLVDSIGISPGNQYHYRLVTLFKTGLTAQDTMTVQTPVFLPPDQLHAQIAVSSGDAVRLTWRNRAESADRFQVERRLTGAPLPNFILIGETADTFFVDANALLADQFYDYQVVAVNNYEMTAPSPQQSILTTYILQAPLITLIDQVSASREVQLQWQSAGNAEDEYRIYRRSEQTDFRRIARLPVGQQLYVDRDTLASLRLDSTYYYAISAFNSFENEESTTSPVQSITITQPTNFAGYNQGFEQSLGPEWSFFSSTAQGRIQRSQHNSYSGDFMLLFDVSQTVVTNTNQATLTLDLSGIQPSDAVVLSFWYNTFEDEVNSFDEIIQVSTDGLTWTSVGALIQSVNSWSFLQINLSNFADRQPFSANYRIRWQQIDNFPYPMDGIGIDDVDVTLSKR